MTEAEAQWVRELIALNQERMSYGAEIVEHSQLFFNDEVHLDEEAREVLSEEQVPEVLSVFLQEVENLESFTADEIKKSVKAIQKATGHKGKKLFMPIRVATSGQTHGPDLMKTIELLGKEKVKMRVSQQL
jgi:nondiscriminating glutamyl-tRNA synthetase